MSFEREPKSGEQGPGRETKFEELGRKLDHEVEELIRWLNDDVVVAARSHSSRAVRAAAEKMPRLADQMDDLKRGR